MDPRLRAKLSKWKRGELTDEEMMGRTSNSLLNFRHQPSPGEVPHHMLSVTPPVIPSRNNPLASVGRNRYPITSNRAGGLRTDPRLGVDPRARAKKPKDPRLNHMQQLMNYNRNRYGRTAGSRGEARSQSRVTQQAQGHNHHPRPFARDARFKASPSKGGRIQKHTLPNSFTHSDVRPSSHGGRSSRSKRH